MKHLCIYINKKLYIVILKYIFYLNKLENILLDQNNNIKITDFNWAI